MRPSRRGLSISLRNFFVDNPDKSCYEDARCAIRIELGPTTKESAKFRSFYLPFADRCDIYYAKGLTPEEIRYYKSKELLQIHLWQESLRTHDVVDLVQNMILRASPESRELDLGHAATADTLGDLAAMEFLFPLARRLADSQARPGKIAELAGKYGIPSFVIQRGFNVMVALSGFFPTNGD